MDSDERSVSSTHQDPYENFYVVAREKIFTMYPPSDIGFCTKEYIQVQNMCVFQMDKLGSNSMGM